MNKLSAEERAGVVACLVEGNSLRATLAMEAGVLDRVWKIEEIARLLD